MVFIILVLLLSSLTKAADTAIQLAKKVSFSITPTTTPRRATARAQEADFLQKLSKGNIKAVISYKGNIKAVISYLEKHPQAINQPLDAKLQTALHLAAASGNADLVRWLLAHGANRDARTIDRRKAVMFAIGYGHLEVARILLDMVGKKKPAVPRIAITPAPATRTPRKLATGPTLTQSRARSRFETALLAGDSDTMATCIDAYSALTVMRLNDRGWTALHAAAFYGHDAAVTLLLSRGASAEAKDDKGLQPHHLAIGRGKNQAALLLRNALQQTW